MMSAYHPKSRRVTKKKKKRLKKCNSTIPDEGVQKYVGVVITQLIVDQVPLLLLPNAGGQQNVQRRVEHITLCAAGNEHETDTITCDLSGRAKGQDVEVVKARTCGEDGLRAVVDNGVDAPDALLHLLKEEHQRVGVVALPAREIR